MNIIQRLSPGYTPKNVRKLGGVQIVRDRILQGFLLGILSIGILAVSFDLVEVISQKRYGLALLYILVFLGVAILTFFRDIPYTIRAGVLIVLPYILAVSEIYDSGLLGEMRFWLLVFTTLTALLLGFKPSLVSTFIAVLTISVLGLGLQFHWLTLPNSANFSMGTDWMVSSFMMVLVSVGIGSAASGLIHGLQIIVDKSDSLSRALEEERNTLDTRIQERTSVIERRLIQVRTAAEISSAISHLTRAETLYRQVVDLIQERMDLYYVGLFLVDDLGRYAVLAAGTGEAGDTMLARGHRLQIGTGSMIGWCISSAEPRIALDVGEDAVRFNNPLLPKTRSELAIPIVGHGKAVGALTVQSENQEAFDQEDITVLQGISDSLASAIENNRLVTELGQTQDELRIFNQTYVRNAWTSVNQEKGGESFSFEQPASNRQKSHSVDIPIMLRDQLIAKLSLETDDAALSDEDMAFLDAITTQTALALDNARLVDELQSRAERERMVGSIATKVRTASDVESILRIAANELGHSLGVSEVVVQLTPPKDI